MRCEVVAIGTELLLGQIVDTNSAWIGEQLAAAGIDCLLQTKVGDNTERIVAAVRSALERADAVICCGGLGPTQDDITREALAEVMGVALERDEAVVEHIAGLFAARGRSFPASNARQADRPVGSTRLDNPVGTAPGLLCPIPGNPGRATVVYAVPGVPNEMQRMLADHVLPDLRRRSGPASTIASRTLRTWGLAESALAEVLADRITALDAEPLGPTIAFLASGIEGIKLRVTVRAPSAVEASSRLDHEEVVLRGILAAAAGPVVFGVDDETMEHAVGSQLLARGWTLGVAESLTGGLVASRIVDVPGASRWFRGAIVSYASEVKFGALGVTEGPVVSEQAAREMAEAARSLMGADVGLGVTGVAGPDAQDDQPVGTVWLGYALPGGTEAQLVRLPGNRPTVRQLAGISLLDGLRRRLL